MIILVSIDDTDDLESKGTGELASEIAAMIVTKGWGQTTPVTRHQLFIHPDIAYTSHNSSMCFQAEIRDDCFNELLHFAAKFLRDNSAAVADPGLCVVQVQSLDSAEALIQFGIRAKNEIITKEEAYLLAERLHVHLSEHGGLGIGVIGALAGAGLRLSGNDGRFKGKLKINQAVVSVKELVEQTMIEVVRTVAGETLADTELVKVSEPLKTVLKDNKCVLLVSPVTAEQEPGVHWKPCSKQELRQY